MLLGVLVGLTYVIPGLCSASMAMTLGVYDDMIEIFSSFYKIKILKKHCLFILGIMIGLIFVGSLIIILLDKFKWLFLSLFIGFIISGFNRKKCLKLQNKKSYLLIALLVMTTIIFNMVGNYRIISFDKDIDIWTILILFVVGSISSLALILPGISGSMFLFVFGFYDLFSKSIKQIISQLLIFQTLQYENFVVLLSFLGGFLLGILAFSKIIDKISKRYPNTFDLVSKGFLYGSLLVMIFDLIKNVIFSYHLLIALLILVLGYNIGRLITKNNK